MVTRHLFIVPRLGKTVSADAGVASDDCVAISDGLGALSYSHIWSRLLVDKFLQDKPSWNRAQFDKWLSKCAEEWRKKVPWDKLGFLARKKARERGAGSTFLGVRFRYRKCSRFLTWNAFAIGDSCLFHFRKEKLLQAFPLAKPEMFSGRTYALIVKGDGRVSAPPPSSNHFSKGRLLQGDSLVLTTDALALWILEQVDKSPEAIQNLLSCETLGDFECWVRTKRDAAQLNDDDTTLSIIRFTHSSKVSEML